MLARNLALAALALAAAAAAQADPAHDLLGRWTTGFVTDPQGAYQYRQTFNFDGQNCTLDFDVLINHPLGQGGFRQAYQCTYKLGGPARTVAGAYDIDIAFTHRIETALHPETVKDYNNDKECGLDGWALGVPRDVTGRDCDEGDPDLIGTMYTVVKITPDDKIQLGLLPEGSPIGTDAAHRPTELDPENVTPRNGHGGTAGPPPEDLLSGFYAVTGYARNATGCGTPAAAPAPFQAVEVYANASVIPLVVGWSSQLCASVDTCKAEANTLNFTSDFPLEEDDGAGRFAGNSKQLW